MAGSEISLSAGEQSDGMEQISQAVSPFDQLTQENAAIVEQTAAAGGDRTFAPVCRRAAPVCHP